MKIKSHIYYEILYYIVYKIQYTSLFLLLSITERKAMSLEKEEKILIFSSISFSLRTLNSLLFLLHYFFLLFIVILSSSSLFFSMY